MNSFDLHTPTKIAFGENAESRVGELVRQFGGTRVLVHFGGKSAIASGLLGRVTAALEADGLFHVELGGVVPNPHLAKVREGIALGKENKIDFILAVGGGSVIDSAKAIAYGLAEPEKDVWDLYAHTREATACLPVGSILTIAAAGSETSMGSVITNEATGEKRAYDDDLSRPKFAVMNPALTLSLPDYQTMSGCADILMHTMERYFTQGDTLEITDAIAEALMRTVIANARLLHKDPLNLKARAEVMWAGSLSHNGLTGCGNDGGDFATHMLEHELGGMFDVTHGAGLAAIWPSWARHVCANDLPRFVRFARNVMQIEGSLDDDALAEAGIAAMESFYREIGMPTNLAELGVNPTDDQIREMADSCAQATGGRIGSAKVLFQEDLIAIYTRAR